MLAHSFGPVECRRTIRNCARGGVVLCRPRPGCCSALSRTTLAAGDRLCDTARCVRAASVVEGTKADDGRRNQSGNNWTVAKPGRNADADWDSAAYVIISPDNTKGWPLKLRDCLLRSERLRPPHVMAAGRDAGTPAVRLGGGLAAREVPCVRWPAAAVLYMCTVGV